MGEEERFQLALNATYERWYALRGIKPTDTKAKIGFLETQLGGKYQVEPTNPEVHLALLQQAHFLEQVN